MYEAEVDALVHYLSNFYRDNMPEDSSYEKMFKIFIQSVSFVWEELNYIDNHLTVEEAPTLYTLPYFQIDIQAAKYDVEKASSISLIPTLEEQINQLDKDGLYAQFKTKDHHSRTPVVFSMDLKLRFEDEEALVLYEDYFIRNNRLYLLPSFITDQERQANVLHGFNIKLNNHAIEKNWGTFFDVEAGALLPRKEYQNVISAFRRLMYSQLTISDIKEAISLATDWGEFDIQDHLSPSLSESKKRLYKEWMLSPAKFLVTLPETLIKDKMRLNIMLALLNEAKEEDKDYHILFYALREDFIWESLEDRHVPTIHMSNRDIIDPGDEHTKLLFYRVEERLFSRSLYDVGRHYDHKLMHDDDGTASHLESVMDNEDYVWMDDPDLLLDTPWVYQNEYVHVRHVEFPEIPRQVSFQKDANNVLTFSIRSNTDGTLKFELWGSTIENAGYVLLETIDNDSSVPQNLLIHDANQSGNRYYKLRAVTGDSKSLMTLPLDTQSE